jgi:hypothetical protein
MRLVIQSYEYHDEYLVLGGVIVRDWTGGSFLRDRA